VEEMPKAYVASKEGNESEDLDMLEVKQYCKERLDEVVRFVEGISKLPSGKIVKRTLRE
jgi:acyl-coenzyme A synthetase/AMP-(fatty) acid ligase